jgi:basic membrane protein A and related proteins
VRRADRTVLLTAAGAVMVALFTPSCSNPGDKRSGQDATARRTVKVGLAYDLRGRGDKSYNDAAAAGLERAKKDLDVQAKELEAQKGETEDDKYHRLKLLCGAGYDPVVAVGFIYAGPDPATGPMARAARDCPHTRFAIVDDATVHAGNVANLVFAEEQGSFLVGAAAALKSKTSHIGFVGGCLVDAIKKFQAGYEAGAKAVKASIIIDVRYLSTAAEVCSGFNAPDQARTAAESMYDRGADVVYHAAGGSGLGVFRAAKAKGRWAIGVDTDQYELVGPELRGVILTSMLKRVDTAVFDFVKAVGAGRFTPGITRYDLKVDGVGYATSGGAVTDIKPKLDDFRRQIIDGRIVVPTQPAH